MRCIEIIKIEWQNKWRERDALSDVLTSKKNEHTELTHHSMICGLY